MNKQDACNILGISGDADDSEIKMAFRRNAMKYHPDRNPGDKNSEENFKKSKAAFDFLMEKNESEQVESSFDPFSEIFGAIFGQFRRPDQIISVDWSALGQAAAPIQLNSSLFGGHSVEIYMPTLQGDGTEFNVEAHGYRRRVRVEVTPPRGWHHIEGGFEKRVSLTTLDKILGGDFSFSLPNGEEKSIRIPPVSLEQFAFEVPVSGYTELRFRIVIDFLKEIHLNDTDRDLLIGIRNRLNKGNSK